jgi:hypothetical protein
VLARMEDAGMAVKFIILDACRNDPFGRGQNAATGSQSLSEKSSQVM